MKRVAGIVLAAGASTRLGQPKQLIVLAGESLLERTVRLCFEADLDPVVVVLGAQSDLIATRCALERCALVMNEAWKDGIASSIGVGAGFLTGRDVRGAVVMTCDQPAVTTVHLEQLQAGDPKRVRASRYAGRHGVPAYFPKEVFASLLMVRGDEGARAMLAAADAIELPGGDFDVDTPAALLELRERYS